MKNILVVNVNWVGDVIFSSPVFKALKDQFPEAHIGCLAPPRVNDVLKSIPFIDEGIIYDEENAHRGFLAKIKLIIAIRRKRFDAVFFLHRSLTRALLMFLAGIPQRIGYDEKNRGWFLTHVVDPDPGPLHRSDRYLRVVESYGIAVRDRTCRLEVSGQAKKDIEEALRARGIKAGDYVAVIHPGGNWNLKRWPEKNFAMLVDRLADRFAAKVVISGSAQDAALSGAIIQRVKSKPVNLTGETNLAQLIALMHRADLVISGDSGPLHIAHGAGSNVIGLYGPTRPEITGPRGGGRACIIQHDVGCNRQACYYLRCPDNICMQSVTVDDVLKAVEQIRNK